MDKISRYFLVSVSLVMLGSVHSSYASMPEEDGSTAKQFSKISSSSPIEFSEIGSGKSPTSTRMLGPSERLKRRDDLKKSSTNWLKSSDQPIDEKNENLKKDKFMLTITEYIDKDSPQSKGHKGLAKSHP